MKEGVGGGGGAGVHLKLRGIEAGCQLPDMGIHRDGLGLVQRKKADACRYLMPHHTLPQHITSQSPDASRTAKTMT